MIKKSVTTATAVFGVSVLTLVLLFSRSDGQASESNHFLVLKLGDSAATQSAAAEYLQTVAEYLQSKVELLSQKPLRGWIANRVDSAKAILQEHDPILAFVPAGFYLQHLHGRSDVWPLVQTPRFGKSVDRYYLVASKNTSVHFSDLRGRTLTTAFAVDLSYLQKVVFPSEFQPNIDFALQPSQNLADDVFLMIESGAAEELGQNPPPAILMDEELKAFFEADDLVWPELKVIWQSEALPRELFVAIGELWTDRARQHLFNALVTMKNDPPGNQLLQLLNSSGFSAVDSELLERTVRKYLAAE